MYFSKNDNVYKPYEPNAISKKEKGSFNLLQLVQKGPLGHWYITTQMSNISMKRDRNIKISSMTNMNDYHFQQNFCLETPLVATF